MAKSSKGKITVKQNFKCQSCTFIRFLWARTVVCKLFNENFGSNLIKIAKTKTRNNNMSPESVITAKLTAKITNQRGKLAFKI